MEFAHGQTVFRHRYPLIQDRYNPARKIPDYSGTPETEPLERAFVASSSSVSVRDATRSQILTDKSLYLTDVSADVQVGDRIGTTEDPDAAEFQIEVVPSADTNPFTGWQPVQEIPLEGAVG